jgi:hypothetical protein
VDAEVLFGAGRLDDVLEDALELLEEEIPPVVLVCVEDVLVESDVLFDTERLDDVAEIAVELFDEDTPPVLLACTGDVPVNVVELDNTLAPLDGKPLVLDEPNVELGLDDSLTDELPEAVVDNEDDALALEPPEDI